MRFSPPATLAPSPPVSSRQQVTLPPLDRPAELWLALLITGGVAALAWRAKSLSGSGAVAAIVVGTVALCATWGLGGYLVVWFLLASLLSRLGRERKAERLRGIVEKGDRRDARQVLANGAVFAAAAIGSIIWPQAQQTLHVAAAAALAAAGADTWATEIGTLIGGQPWSLRLRTPVPTGSSGAITWAGSLGSVLGATALAFVAQAVHVIPVSAVFAVTIGGIAGAFADSVIGAWWQGRRLCPSCMRETEQLVHVCGAQTVPHGGVGRLDNDAVNLCCTLVGAVTAIAVAG